MQGPVKVIGCMHSAVGARAILPSPRTGAGKIRPAGANSD